MRIITNDASCGRIFCLLGALMIEREGGSAAEMWLALTTPKCRG
jgi:hypothetical protein